MGGKTLLRPNRPRLHQWRLPSATLPCAGLNTMKYFIPTILLSLYLFSCASKEERKVNTETSQSGKTVSFEKLDSIQIDYLGIPTVHDLNPKSKKILFVESGEFSEEIMVADFSGNILNSFSKFGDMPDGHGGLFSTLRFVGDSTFIAYGWNGFLIYNLSGRLKSRMRLREYHTFDFNRKGMGYGMEKHGEKYLYLNPKNPDLKYSEVQFYNDIRLLAWLDPETGEKYSFIQFPETSIFRNGKYFFRDSWSPVFTLDDEYIYVAFGSEPIIYKYEANPPNSLISSFSLDLPNYHYFKGEVDYGPGFELKGFSYGSGRILNIKKIEKFFIVAYFRGYEKRDRDESFANKSIKEERAFNKRMYEKYPLQIAVLDSMGNLLNDFVPEGLVASSMLVRNGELWMQENPNEEVEEDYFRLFRVGLKFD